MLKKMIITAALGLLVLGFVLPPSLPGAAEINNIYFTKTEISVAYSDPSLTEESFLNYLINKEPIIPINSGEAAVTAYCCINGNGLFYVNSKNVIFGNPKTYTYVPKVLIEEEKPKLKSLGYHKVTTYCSCEKCCGPGGGKITAAGTTPTVGRTIGCNWLPLGTHIVIEGHEYIVEDRGASWVKGFDIYWGNDHQAALHSGYGRKIEIFVVE